MSKITEADVLKEATDNGKMDNPKLDPPDVAKVKGGDNGKS